MSVCRKKTNLNAIDFAAITNIKWVHNEKENDGFKDGFAGVSEYKGNQEELRA